MKAVQLKRSVHTDADFQKLIIDLDKDLWSRYPEIQQNFTPFNHNSDAMKVIVAYVGDEAVGCGCFKPFGQDNAVEIKRMYVAPDWRGHKIGATLLTALEHWAAEEGYHTSKLETGNNQPEAIALYERSGYGCIPNFPPYEKIKESICIAKPIG